MKKNRGPTDPNLVDLVRYLRKASVSNEAPIWRAISKKLGNSRKNRPSVNLSQINRFTKEGDIVIVPGKVLSSGHVSHKITIAAWKYSETALMKLGEAESTVVSIRELVNTNPKGTNIRIIA